MEIGKYNVLRVSRGVDFGLYLADADGHEVLLPRRYVTDSMTIGSEIEVFVYIDSENRPVATTERPTAVVGDFVLMRVKAVNATGAF
ncbi:MAG: S1 RNA-binding domain-containing protein, partial [Muribaculaceae bacterium]|nr:S1 RNA-binding domain-containing protein [Muribaculaceae bacterium]